LLLSAATILSLPNGVALAEAPKLIPDGQFASEGPLGVAVDQSASGSDPSRGDVYVAGFFSEPVGPGGIEVVQGRVNKFDPSGNLITPPSPVGEALAYSGAAVNPANGDVYALDALASQIDTYDPATGAPVSPPFSVQPSGNFFSGFTTVVGIASDSAGDVYVPVVPKDEVREYSPSGEELKTFTGGGALKGPTGVAVDPAGNLWVADAGNERIEELSPADAPIREIGSEGVQAVAVDAGGDVFATVRNSADFCGKIKPPCSHLVEYSSTGAQLADVGVGSIGAQTAAAGEPNPPPNMVAVSDASGRVYVTEGLVTPPEGVHGRVYMFTPPVAPKLEGELAVEVGVSEAKLGAVVNPGGISAAYRFEYGTTEAYGSRVPFPEGDTGGGFHPRTVWASPSGLLPGTTYHYRVVIIGELGEPIVGKDQTFTTKTAARAACANEQLRTGFSEGLPDCRTYELVTPPNKEGAVPDPPGELNDIEKGFKGNFAAVDGNRMSFRAENVFPGSKGTSEYYVASRGAGGWSSENMFPSTNAYGFECGGGGVPQYSPDLSKAILSAGSGGECGLEPELVRGEPRGVANLFVRDNTDGSYQLVNVTPPGVTPANATLAGASDDFSHVVFTERAALSANAPSGVVNVYEWSGGVVRLVTVLQGGTGVAGSLVGISRDGSRVFFTAGGSLYARVNGTSTVQLDASQAGGSGGGGSFLAASADGSQVLFSDDASAGLTGDTTPGSATYLYRYDFASGRLSHVDASHAGGPGGGASFIRASADGSQVLFSADASAGLTGDTVPGSATNLYRYDSASGRLSDLTPGSQAELQGVFASGEDLSYVYFVASGSLASGATQGQPNDYLWHNGMLTFLAGLTNSPVEHLEVSKNGAFLAFASPQSLTGYDNTNVNTGKPEPEVYLYDAVAGSLACVSCNPSGAPPTSGPRWGSNHNLTPRNLSENGRVFFDTFESLLPADANRQRDVYEFEPDGVGSCDEPGGCVSLISTGTGSLETWFIEASPSGDDVFLREFQKLVPQDTVEESQTIYDVRVNGGFAEPAAPPACTTADACRTASAPQPSIFGAPASQTFSGAGNLLASASALSPRAKPRPKLKRCRKGYVKNKKDRCVKARKARKARNTNRKGSR
jgi:hypothetical protein